MASDKVVDWEVGSIDTSGNLAIDGGLETSGELVASKLTAGSLSVTDSFIVNAGSITASKPFIIDGTYVTFSSLPTADSGLAAGQLWSNSGVLTVSAGS